MNGFSCDKNFEKKEKKTKRLNFSLEKNLLFKSIQ